MMQRARAASRAERTTLTSVISPTTKRTRSRSRGSMMARSRRGSSLRSKTTGVSPRSQSDFTIHDPIQPCAPVMKYVSILISLSLWERVRARVYTLLLTPPPRPSPKGRGGLRMISSCSCLVLQTIKLGGVSGKDAAPPFIIQIGEQELKSLQDSIVRSRPQAHRPIAAEH